VTHLRAPAGTNVDARRFVYCLLAAAALHAVGAISPRRHARRPHTEAPSPLRTLVPISSEDMLIPVEPDEAPEPAASPPAPPSPPTLAPDLSPPAPRAPAAPPDPERPRHKSVDVAAVAPPRRADAPKPSDREARSPEAPSPFSGKEGAFRARVCMLERDVETALAVENCKAVTSFRTDAIDIPPRRFTEGFPGYRRRAEFFGVDYRGRFNVRAAGYYTFRLLSDDGSVLYIDGEQVIDNDGQHPPRSQKMSLPLSKGEHQFRLLYYQGPGSKLALQLFVKGFKSEERLFGPEL
jgi:hypothetical protein